jgi:ribose-phosphate pyrophosphokinase
VVVSPDVGGAKRAQQLRELLARRLGMEPGLAFVEKRRSGGVLSSGALVGEVRDAQCLIVDDLVSSGTTLARAADICRAGGARRLWVAVAHALLLPASADTLAGARIDQLLITDSVPVPAALASRVPLQILGLGPYLGGVLRRIWDGGSVSELTGMEG